MTFDDLRHLVLLRLKAPLTLDGQLVQISDLEFAESEYDDGVQCWFFASYCLDVQQEAA